MPNEECERYVRISILVKLGPLLIKHGIVKYTQFHLTPQYKKLRGLIGSKEDYDAITEFFMPSYENMENFYNDPEYMEKIRPDESKFVDPATLVFCVGEEYVVIRDNKVVRGFNESPY